jgi:hypothetical protein
MIEIFAVVLLAFVVAMVGMAVGILTGRRGLGGGCTALRTVTDDAPACQACGRPADKGSCTGTGSPTDTGMMKA